MIQRVIMPVLGETVERATIETWHKKEGDRVERGDILCEITTDKATLEVESYYTGTILRIVAQPGVELPVETLIAIVGEPGEAIPEEIQKEAEAVASGGAPPAKAAKAPKAPVKVTEGGTAARQGSGQISPAAAKPEAPAESVAAVEEAPRPPAGRIFASPRARKLAVEEHVPLVVLRGSGPEGRIVEADVRGYVAKLDQLKVTPLARKVAHQRGVDVAALAADGRKVTKEDVLAAPPAAPRAAGRVLKSGRVGLTPMRRIIAERMSQSKREIPCYYVHMDVDMTDLMESRKRLNARGEAKVSVNDYIILACGRALAEFPECNTKWDGDGIVYRGEANVGLAVDLNPGLIVPVVRGVERKGLLELAAETRSLVEKARSKRLTPREFEGGSMTVSNLGMFGVKHFIPIVNPGESCILGLGIIEDRVVARQGNIRVRKMMTMTMALDHRLIDGALGARFTEKIRDLLEAPAELEK